MSPACRSPWPRTSASARAARFYESAGCLRDVIAEPPVPDRRAARHGAARVPGLRARCTTRRPSVFQAMRPLTPRRRGARPVRRLPRGAGRRRRLRRRDLLRAAPVHRLVALGGRAVVPALRQVPADDGGRSAGAAEAAAAAAVRRLAARRRAAPTTCASSCSRSRRSRSPRASSGRARTSSASSASSTCAKTSAGEEAPYERLLGDAMAGDGALFTREDAVEAAWAVVDPVLVDHPPCLPYEPGPGGRRRPTR